MCHQFTVYIFHQSWLLLIGYVVLLWVSKSSGADSDNYRSDVCDYVSFLRGRETVPRNAVHVRHKRAREKRAADLNGFASSVIRRCRHRSEEERSVSRTHEEVRPARGRGVFRTDTDNIGQSVGETGTVHRVLPDISVPFPAVTKTVSARVPASESSGIGICTARWWVKRTLLPTGRFVEQEAVKTEPGIRSGTGSMESQ